MFNVGSAAPENYLRGVAPLCSPSTAPLPQGDILVWYYEGVTYRQLSKTACHITLIKHQLTTSADAVKSESELRTLTFVIQGSTGKVK